MIKRAYSIQMSYDVSDEEKHQAEKAILYFNHAEKTLKSSSDYLDLIKNPFQENSDVNQQDIINTRAALRRFRDKSIDNFNEFKTIAFKCVNLMQLFASDTQTVKVMKSFIASIDELESKVNKFVDLFNNLEDKSFSNNVIKHIDEIQQQCEEVEDIIENRIKSHIKNNILTANWVSQVGDELQMKIEQKTPLILDLFNKRQDQLNEEIKERTLKQ